MTTLLALPIMLECLLLGGAKVVGLESMQKRAVHLGFTGDEYRRTGALEVLAAAGLALRIAVPVIGTLAACGLLVLVGGAGVAHVNAGDGVRAVAPAALVVLRATAYLVAAVVA